MSVVAAVTIVTVTGLLGAAILVVASQFMHVEVDERIERVQSALPGVNCGACGYAGCADYAVGVVDSNAPTNLCVPGGEDTSAAVSAIMGVNAGAVDKFKAIVACQGSNQHVTRKYNYAGITTCNASTALHGGSSSCPYGCLGYGDCVQACKFGAITIQEGIARIDLAKCTGCGACEDVCPKRVIWVRPESDKPVVMCANHQRGAMTRAICSAGCIGCMKCERSCPEKAIRVTNNVARIDMSKCKGCRICVNECPVKAIAVPKLYKACSALPT